MAPVIHPELPFPTRSSCPAVALAVGLLLAATAQAHSPVDPATIDVGHPTGHVHDHGNLTWPPQPKNITNVVPLSQPGDEGPATTVQKLRADLLERVALARSGLRKALGARYSRAALIEDTDKSGAAVPARLVYFSHSKNATVEVTLDGQKVRSVKTVAASEYQPEITDAETAEAASIARAHFKSLGQDRVTQLQAFGILAYQPTGSGFYPTRVVYVSFHVDSDAPPEYVAWVDLTGQRVLRSRQEGQ
jgi:hypothetical protein